MSDASRLKTWARMNLRDSSEEIFLKKVLRQQSQGILWAKNEIDDRWGVYDQVLGDFELCAIP